MPTSNASSPSSTDSPQASNNTETHDRYHSGRAIKSCTECRRRKMRCSRSRPCQTCSRFSRKCIYLPDPKRPSASHSNGYDFDVPEQPTTTSYASQIFVNEANISRVRHPQRQQPAGLDLSPFSHDDASLSQKQSWEGVSRSAQTKMMRVADRMAWPTRPQLVYEVSLVNS